MECCELAHNTLRRESTHIASILAAFFEKVNKAENFWARQTNKQANKQIIYHKADYELGTDLSPLSKICGAGLAFLLPILEVPEKKTNECRFSETNSEKNLFPEMNLLQQTEVSKRQQ